MKNSLYLLRKVSETLNSHQTYYQFNKQDEHLSERYRKGRINASKWLNELIFYYIEKESRFVSEFKEQIQNQKKDLADLPESEFKSGLFDELNLIEDMINDRTNNK